LTRYKQERARKQIAGSLEKAVQTRQSIHLGAGEGKAHRLELSDVQFFVFGTPGPENRIVKGDFNVRVSFSPEKERNHTGAIESGAIE